MKPVFILTYKRRVCQIQAQGGHVCPVLQGHLTAPHKGESEGRGPGGVQLKRPSDHPQ